MIRTYQELKSLQTFEARYRYLQLNGTVGGETFGGHRCINQMFYQSPEWRKARDTVILRDNGCDLGLEDQPIYGKVLIHHMNPISERDILEHSAFLLDPEYLVCVSYDTHNAIHYGDETLLPRAPTERKLNDTCPWKSLKGAQ